MTNGRTAKRIPAAAGSIIPREDFMWYDGLLSATVWEALLYLALATHITIASVTIFLHRHQAHKALELHPLVSHFFRLWLWLTTGMVTKQWVAIHRKHHAKCETPEDPHSPQIYGLKKVLLEGAELYRAEASHQETMDTYGIGTPDDWLERKVYSPHPYLGIALMLVIDVLLFGFLGIALWGVQMIWIPFWAAGVINGVGHYWGYRHYEVPDASTNIFPVGILIGGEEFHNNHHTYPNSARLSSKWWEFDIGWFYIRTLERLRLARVTKVAPKVVLGPVRSVDMDTLRALVRNRFQVMYRYRRMVIRRVVRDELARADASYRQLIQRARKLLVREESLLDDKGRARLRQVLERNERLQLIYQFKQRLQDIWRQTSHSQEEMLAALQDWMKQARATGIAALEEFAEHLSRYNRAEAV